MVGGRGIAMNKVFLFVTMGLLAATVAEAKTDKQPVPPKSEQEPIRTRVKTLFKAEYASAERSAVIALATKLMERATEEKENSATRYVMLTEAIYLATKAGEIDVAMRAARQIDQD